MSDKRKNIDKYHEVICDICHIWDMERINNAEMNGYQGIAMVMAYLDGMDADLYSLSRYLDISPYHLKEPFDRLKINGIFSEKYNARNDKCLRGTLSKGTNFITSNHMSEIAWTTIAGISSGYCGIR